MRDPTTQNPRPIPHGKTDTLALLRDTPDFGQTRSHPDKLPEVLVLRQTFMDVGRPATTQYVPITWVTRLSFLLLKVTDFKGVQAG